MLAERVAELLVRELLATNAVGEACRDALDAFFGGGAVVHVSVGVALAGDLMMDVGNLAREGGVKRVALLHPARSLAGHAMTSGLELGPVAADRSGDDSLWPPTESATRSGNIAACHLAYAAIVPEAGSAAVLESSTETEQQPRDRDGAEGATRAAAEPQPCPALGVLTCGFESPLSSSGLDRMRVLASCLHASLTRQLPLLLPILQLMNPSSPPLSFNNCSCMCDPALPAKVSQKRPSCRDVDTLGGPDIPPSGGFTPTVSLHSDVPIFEADLTQLQTPSKPEIAVGGKTRTSEEGIAALENTLALLTTLDAGGEGLGPLSGLHKDAVRRSIDGASLGGDDKGPHLRGTGAKNGVRRRSLDVGRFAGGSGQAHACRDHKGTAKGVSCCEPVRAGKQIFLGQKSQSLEKLKAQLQMHSIWLTFADKKAETEYRQKSNVERKQVDMQLLTFVFVLAILSGFLSPFNMHKWHLFPVWVAAWVLLLIITYTCSSERYGRYRGYIVAAIMLTGRVAECRQLLYICRERAELLGSAAIKSMFLMPVIYFTDGIFLRVLFRASPLFRALDLLASTVNVRLATIAGYGCYSPQLCALVAYTANLSIGTLLPLAIIRYWEKGERTAYAAARFAAAEE